MPGAEKHENIGGLPDDPIARFQERRRIGRAFDRLVFKPPHQCGHAHAGGFGLTRHIDIFSARLLQGEADELAATLYRRPIKKLISHDSTPDGHSDLRCVLIQLTVMPAYSTTFIHFVISFFRNAANAGGDSTSGREPSPARSSVSSGAFRICVRSRCRRMRILRGVAAGATNPFQIRISYPGTPDSAMVGTPGSNGHRCAVVTAIIFSRPALICGNDEVGLLKATAVSPLSTAVVASALPLYGTCSSLTPASMLNNSPPR